MSEDTPTFEVRTPIGRTLLLQALSAILIMGSIVMPVLTLEIGFIWFVVLSGLWVIAFIQMIIVRAILQKEEWGVSAALVVSLIALVLSVIAGVSWLFPLIDILNGVYFTIIGIVNALLFGILIMMRKSS